MLILYIMRYIIYYNVKYCSYSIYIYIFILVFIVSDIYNYNSY